MAQYIDSNFVKYRIISLNTRGFDVAKQQFCYSILNRSQVSGCPEVTILCNQENFLLRGNRHLLKNALPGYHAIFKPAIKDKLEGRPKNGMFIAVPEILKSNVTDVSPQSWRVQAVLLTTTGKRLLILNVYFPQDPRTSELKSDDLEEVLADIKGVLEKNTFDDVLLTGDMNTDFSRNTGFVKRVEEFLNEWKLSVAWDRYPVDFTHECSKDGKSYTSTIDHFLWSQNLEDNIAEAGVHHDVDNTSDHHPIYTLVKYDDVKKHVGKDAEYKAKPSWKKASDAEREKYILELEEKLKTLDIPTCLGCTDIHCSKSSHVDKVDEHMCKILQVVEECCKDNLPTPTARKSKQKKNRIASWYEEVQPYKENAQFWHAVWLSTGKPLNSQLHKIMKHTRNVYHYQIRKCKHAADRIKRNALLDACLNNNGDIFVELKKMRRSTPTQTSAIDGVSENIPNHFAEIYKNLYNSAPDKDNVQNLYEKIDRMICSDSMKAVDEITPKIVEEAIRKVKSGKNDPINTFSSDCVKNAPSVLHDHLAYIFRSYLVHGHISKVLMLSTLVPLLKDKLGDQCTSSNYRSIALSSLILKIFDWVLILICEKELIFDDLQFSYQANCSTNMCSWMVVETIDFFLRNGSEVFTSVMDMTKAFDNVRHSKLFTKVLERGVPAIFIRLLMVAYKNQELLVSWNGELSSAFTMGNGVKQGAVLSALLYNIYVDDLFKRLRKRKVGCWINGVYLGILGYADDIFLLSPSIDGLQSMIDTCADYGKEHGLTFSTSSDPRKCKTKCLAFLKKDRKIPNLTLDGKDLPWVDTAMHLGNKITNKGKGMRQDVMEKRAAYISRNNELYQELYFAHPKSLVRINNIYNSHFYGSTLWDLQSKEVDMVLKTWNVSQRVMHGLDRKTHKYLIEPISETKHIVFHFHKRFVNFVKKIQRSKKLALRCLFGYLKSDCQSTIGRNIRHLQNEYHIGEIGEFHTRAATKKEYATIPKEEEWRIHIIKELIDVRQGMITVPGLSYNELKEILTFAAAS